MRKLKQLLMIMVLMVALAVPSSAPVVGPVSTVSAASVKISNTSITLTKGKTKQLKIRGTSKKVTWSSSNKKVATVTSKGKVTAKKVGKATITAKVNGKKYRCKVTVKAAPAKQNTVWLPATGKKYHKIPNCGRMNPKRAKKVTLKEAKRRGYKPCSKCF